MKTCIKSAKTSTVRDKILTNATTPTIQRSAVLRRDDEDFCKMLQHHRAAAVQQRGCPQSDKPLILSHPAAFPSGQNDSCYRMHSFLTSAV